MGMDLGMGNEYPAVGLDLGNIGSKYAKVE
jgi:hypothetical protein